MLEKQTFKILLVDDSEDDRWLLRRSLQDHPEFIVIGEVTDGDEAIAWLEGHPPFADRELHPLPDALLLDLKMPRKTGYEVLDWLIGKSFNNMVVVVLSGSFLPADIAKSFSLGAHAYYKKTAISEEQQTMLIEIGTLMRKSKGG